METRASTQTDPARKTCFVFVCQAGELEIKALLLAASLKRFVADSHEMVAAVPGPESTWGALAESTLTLLRSLGVRIEPIENPIGPDYPIGNKLACLNVLTTADRLVFLDSDIVCLRKPDMRFLASCSFAAKPADLRTFSASTDAWRPLYDCVNVPMPTLTLPTTVSEEFGLAYFNSGMISVDASSGVGPAWIDCARAVQPILAQEEQEHWLDQVALALAVHRLRLPYLALDERYNFPAHLKPLSEKAPPFFCHYHWPRIILREPALHAVVRDLAREHGELAELIARDPAWSGVLDPQPVAQHRHARVDIADRQPSPDVIVTEIPCSGAAEVGQQLATFENCRFIEAPPSVLPALSAPQPPWEIASLMRDLRRDITAEHPTIGTQAVLALYAPQFIYRLDALRTVLPHAKIIVLVRDPATTIATWKCSRHDPIPWIDPSSRYLSDYDKAALNRIGNLSNPAEQRAAWWWWLAKRLVNHASGVTIVRHDELRDETFLRHALRGLELGQTRTTDPSDRETTEASSLEDDDHQAIRAICMQAAADLGLL